MARTRMLTNGWELMFDSQKVEFVNHRKEDPKQIPVDTLLEAVNYLMSYGAIKVGKNY